MLGKYLENVRTMSPLVHCITNAVTVNDVANALLAAGAHPVMADEPAEAAEIARGSDALNLNIGTLNHRTIRAMKKAGKEAKRCGKPVILDPVGAGASRLRTKTALRLMNRMKPTIIRGNASEIHTLMHGNGRTRGVDAAEADVIRADAYTAEIAAVMELAARTGSIIIVTGAVDFVADGERCFVIHNGCAEMGKITGTGCQLSALLAAFAAANPGELLNAAAAAVCMMGIAGELAWKQREAGEGNASCRNHMIDTIYHLDAQALDTMARYELHTAKGKMTEIETEDKHMIQQQKRQLLKKQLLLYGVTDRKWTVPRQQTLEEQVEEALQGGVTMLQLREKHLNEDEFYTEAMRMKEICRRYGVPLIINDRVDIAERVDADGVHVGQEDMNAAEVRKCIGEGKLLGVSAQTVEQAQRAEAAGADYLGVGAVFPTTSKEDAAEVSLETLREICNAVSIPVVAIGGITAENVKQLEGSGIVGIAVISAIFGQPHIRTATEGLKQKIEHM